MTHPFHPLAGERLAVIFERCRRGVDRVFVCEGGPAGRVTLLVGWTDHGEAVSGHRLAVEGLVELAGAWWGSAIRVSRDGPEYDLVR